ncbi:structural maintenance of chromosomes protein 3 [Diachasma alloeum]|uniref:Structural maintenance of chromosomes protein n=1 Tax=Diachasma alloeum TaxID=454923 RepID=A0A4E0S0X9_9HYME|nr:structural maintenance of chromosomes protein 3 [Diachasma alloeum]THK32940.1 structural maintenance of chromosomes 3B [Diachasma alloeum]
MHIKQIVIENFRSYRGHHVFDGLHPGHNAIVGLNGSGKSSLLESISFVLSNRYYPITKDQTISVINDNPINHTRSASVEIILSNDDNVLSVDAPEVRIRRVISLEFDRITINNESFDPADLFQLLSPVFPRENPYYIVRQDEVAHLATGTDSARFKVISTAIGVHKFDEGITNLVSEIAKKTEHIEHLQADLDRHSDKLSSMTTKYQHFTRINKTRRYLEHKLYGLNLRELKSDLSRLAEPYEEELLKAEGARKAYESVNSECVALNAEANSLQGEIDLLKKLKRKAEAEDIELTKELNALGLEEAEIREKLQGLESGELESFDERRQKLVSRISDLEEKSKTIEKELLETREGCDEACRELERHEYQLVGLFRKKMMVEKLRAGDHDLSDIMPRASQVTRTIREEEEEVAQQEINVEKAFARKTEGEKELGKLRNQLNEVKLLLRDQKREKEELQRSRCDLLGRRKELQREADMLRDDIETLVNRIGTIKRKLQVVVRGDVLEGIESVRKILDDWRQRDDRLDLVNGVKGILLEVFTCSQPSVAFAVEVRGGDQLFHHVVRDRLVISEVLREMRERSLRGIVNFIPLGDVEDLEVRYPPREEFNCRPMVSFLVPREDEFKKAVDFVFGKTVIVINLKDGIAVARTHDLQAITPQGQQVLGKGKFRGGFRDNTTSRVELYREFSEQRDRLDEVKSTYKRLLYSLQRTDEELLLPMSDLQKLDMKIYASEQHISRLQIDIAEASRSLELANDEYFPLRKYLNDTKMRLEESRLELSVVEAEIEELERTSVEEVEVSIQQLQEDSLWLEKRKKKATADIPHLETRLSSIREILSRFQRDKDELEEHARDYSPDLLQERLVVVQQNQEKCRRNLEEVGQRLEPINEKIIALTKQLSEVEKTLRELDFEVEKARMIWAAAKEDVETIESKMDSLKEKMGEWEKRLANVGTLPSIRNHRVFDDMGKKALERMIRDMGREEKSLGAVDSGIKAKMKKLEGQLKALEELVVREEERKRSYEVEMERIEGERVEALRVGFERINEFFGEIFGEIVVNGRARLYPVDEDGGEVEDGDWGRVRGVRMRATFVGGQEVERMHQLSGGQKTVIALTLIFAVHRFKPAPFYLLDEIDKALDESFRASVAGLVHGLSGSAQFLIITFREELLMQAQRYFKVTSRHDCSHVEGCSREEAVEIIRRDPEDE